MDYQKEFWNAVAGPKWVAQQKQLDAVMSVQLKALVEAAELKARMAVVDVGCGCGALALEAARQGCSVEGVDISSPMLVRARERAEEEGLKVTFTEADAQTYAVYPGSVDRVISRFGVMFFPDPVAAFSNMRGWLALDGTLQFLCWQSLDQNPWLSEVVAVAEPWLDDAASDPYAPGPFSLAEPEHLREVLSAAGFSDVRLSSLRRPMRIAGNLDEVVAFYLERGPIKVAMEKSSEAAAAVETQLRTVISRHHDGSAAVLGSAAWLVRASF